MLDLALGLGGWLQLGYERSPDPQRVTVVAHRPDVRVVVERFPCDPAPPSELSGAGFTLAEPAQGPPDA